jgi:uncharacterized membrane protein YhaH (DUF805 family)
MFRNLQGRINRASYWAAILTGAAVFALIRMFDPKATLAEVVVLFICVPRLHDIGRSGWWAGAAIIGEFVMVGFLTVSLDAMLVASGLYVMLIGLLMIVLGCIPGQADTNRFGPPPAPGLGWSKTRPTPAQRPADEQG